MISRERSLPIFVALVFLIGGILGGGPVSPLLSMFVELVASFLGAIALAGLIDGNFPRHAKPGLILLGLICLVPLVQLVPLPADIWRKLPGHDVPFEISRLAGLGDLARPISLSPEQTGLAALALIVPAAIFMATLQFGTEGRDRVFLAIVAFAFASTVLGIFQVAAGSGVNLGIYKQVHDGYPIGFFANRNHEADLLLIALPVSAYLVRSRPWPRRTRTIALAIATMFFSLSVIATQSRTGVALLPIALGGVMAVWIGDIRDRRIWLGLAGLFAVALVGYAIVRLTPVGHHLASRFSDLGYDLRPVVWQGTSTATGTFWPVGSGVGSFVPVYQMFEDLNSISDMWVNHAHNEYLELLLDTGIAAAILFGGYVIVAILALLGEVAHEMRRQRYVAICIILILLAHSVMDYPLHTFALLAIFAFANAMLFPAREMRRVRRSGSHPVSPPPAFAMDYDHA